MGMTQKVSTMTDNNWGERFGNKGLSALSGFLTTYNVATQAVAFADANCATTGGAACCINGVYIPALTAELATDWDSDTAATSIEGDAQGVYIPNLYSAYIAIFADADGRLKIDMAGEIALDADVTCKVNWFDPSEWCCIGIALVNSAGCTLGTTNINSIVTIYQIIGPMLPHPSNLSI